ncbi:MAG: hypothetical protein AB7H80_11550 [Candidatus Kapaibacterium sp.]
MQSLMNTRRFTLTTLTSLLLFLPLTVSLRAQIDTTERVPGTTVGSDFYNNTYFAIGLHASLLSGSGLAGRVSFPKGFAVQTTAFIISLGGITHFNVGGEGQYAFTQGDGGRLYGLVGGGYYLSTSEDTAKSGNRIKSPVHLGLGVGYEWFTSRNFALDLSGAFTWFIAEKKVAPLPSFGFHYYFR